MQKYQIIARKFRPQRFTEVVGQDAIVTTLKNGLSLGRIGQAYLFCGARGCGKTTLARLFAKSLCCIERGTSPEPCLNCDQCKDIAEGKNLNVLEIDGASNRSIDDVRRLSEMIGYAPIHSPYKVYIIDEVHMLTKEAFNALLKILEEPPPHAKFFFATTEAHKIPPTIISRCQRFNLQRISLEAIQGKLQEIATSLDIAIEKEALFLIGSLAEGSLRDAQSLLDQLICFGEQPITAHTVRTALSLLSETDLKTIDEAILSQNQDLAHLLAGRLFHSGKDLLSLIDELLSHFRHHLLSFFDKSEVQSPLYTKAIFTKKQLTEILSLLLSWQQEAGKMTFKQIHLEMLLLSLVKKSAPSSLENLMERLLEFEEKIRSLSEREKENFSSTQFVPTSSLTTTQPIPKWPPDSPKIPLETKEEKITQEHLPTSSIESQVKIEGGSKSIADYQTLLRFAAVELEGTISKQTQTR